jgi:hypothetical protein
LIIQPDSRNEQQLAEPRKDVKERQRRFQIVKLEERIAPGGGSGNGSNLTCGNPCHPVYSHNPRCNGS